MKKVLDAWLLLVFMSVAMNVDEWHSYCWHLATSTTHTQLHRALLQIYR